MAQLDIQITQRPNVDEEVNEYTQEQLELIGDLVQSTLRGPRSLWPVLTGQSKRAMRASFVGDRIVIRNRFNYVGAVNNRQRYPSGKRNPNYRALQRTIERQWRNITNRLGG